MTGIKYGHSHIIVAYPVYCTQCISVICNTYSTFQQLISFLTLRDQIKHMEVLKEIMEVEFWSIDVPLDCKKELKYAFRVLKLGYAALLLNLAVVTTIQYFLDLYPHLPFISSKIYPYYWLACVLYTIGSYITTYAHCITHCYVCLHLYCQVLLLSEYFKQLELNSENNKGIEINVTDHILFGIKQHAKLIR